MEDKKDFHLDRMAICRSCDEFKGFTAQCGICHCFMPLKTRIAIMECPVGKWLKVSKE